MIGTVNAPKTILVTRPKAAGSKTAAKLKAMGFVPVLAPLTKIVADDNQQPLFNAIASQKFDGVMVTSANALAAIQAQYWRQFCQLPLVCVGQKSARLARQMGLIAPIYSAIDIATLTELEAFQNMAHIAYLTGHRRQPFIEDFCRQSGQTICPLPLYHSHSIAEPFNTIALADIDIILVYSPFSATLLHAYAGSFRQDAKFFCLSKAIKHALPLKLQQNSLVAKRPQEQAIMEELAQFL